MRYDKSITVTPSPKKSSKETCELISEENTFYIENALSAATTPSEVPVSSLYAVRTSSSVGEYPNF